MREWALQRWPENTQVYLAKELLTLKMEIRNEREAEARRMELELDRSEAEQAEVLLQVQDDRQFCRKH